MGPRAARCALFSLLLLGTACATARPSSTTLFDDLGGEPGLEALVDAFLLELSDDLRVVEFFAETNIPRFRRLMVEHLCVLSDGPCTYTGDTMYVSHQDMDIGRSEFNAVVEDLWNAMETLELPVTTQNRLLARLAPLRSAVLGEREDPPLSPGAPKSAVAARASERTAAEPKAAEPNTVVGPATSLDRGRETAGAPAAPRPVASQPNASAAPRSRAKAVQPFGVDQAWEKVEQWAQSWRSRDVDAYFAHYSDDFEPSSGSLQEWRAERRARLSQPEFIEVEIAGLRLLSTGETQAQVAFRQSYRSDRFADAVDKVLELRRSANGDWLIVRETADPKR